MASPPLAVRRVVTLSLAIVLSRLAIYVVRASSWISSSNHQHMPTWFWEFIIFLGRSGEIMDVLILGQLCSFCGSRAGMRDRHSQVWE